MVNFNKHETRLLFASIIIIIGSRIRDSHSCLMHKMQRSIGPAGKMLVMTPVALVGVS